MKSYKLLSIILPLVALTACSEQNFGHAEDEGETPEVVAIKSFYQAIYRDDDLQKAKTYASDRMDGLIDHYATLQGVERYVLGRYFDQVELSVDTDSLVPYLNKAQEIRATVIFEGEYQGEDVKDSRDVVLVQEQGKWRVDQILDPRYRP
ncbi:hypothetical protein [Idiomarina seosinensis]|uniref:hypothetical protein n=1 Tax=Idiomarina seosinensis TaxID=281739 RepID=UPI001F545ABE|nr:hypothetical protein [Idiomarina seosinensis]